MVVINSKSNNIVKYAMSIKSKKYSKKYGECLVETEKLVLQMLDKGIVSSVLVVDTKADDYHAIITHKSKVAIYYISEDISKYLTDSVTSSGVFAIVKIPKCDGTTHDKALILDGLQDPSNLGAIIRSARAFDYNDIYMIDTVYPYTYKVIRASMGYVFDMNLISTTYEELLEIKKKHGMEIIVADMGGEDISNVCQKSSNYAIVIGNEGNGVSATMRDMADTTVSISMSNDVESLNASVSASIIMYKFNEIKEN